jgi:uncharacterized protein (TIGR02147 family)
MRQKKGPVIFKYTDYRKYLNDTFEFRKKKNRHFTFRYFSKKAGMSSPSALKEVMEGKKNLTHKSILQFAIGFDLNKSETEYFTNLVYFNQAKTESEKNSYFKELVKLKQNGKGKTLTSKQYEYYSNWYNSAIRELVATKPFKNEPEWIAKRLIPQITPNEAKKALELLTELGLLIKKEDGTLHQDTPKLEVDPDVTTLSIRNFNRSMIDLGKASIEKFSQDNREVSGLTMGVSKECFQELKQMIREFKTKVANYVVNDNRSEEQVYQLNFQFFPLTDEEAGK